MLKINDEFVLDFDKGSIVNLGSGYKMDLGSNELELLKYFVLNKNTLLSKKVLIDHVWTKRGIIVEESSLMNALSNCRKAFDDKTGSVLKTERGKGYRFVATVSDETLTDVESNDRTNEMAQAKTDNIASIVKGRLGDLASLNGFSFYCLIGLFSLCFGFLSSDLIKEFVEPESRNGYGEDFYDSCIYEHETAQGLVNINLGSSRVIYSPKIAIAISNELESVSFPVELVEMFCE